MSTPAPIPPTEPGEVAAPVADAPAFAYRDGVLTVEGVALPAIDEAVGTPVYVYSLATIRDAYKAYADALAPLGVAIHYAVKANGNLAVIRALGQLGAGTDVVSGGELRRSLAAGIPPDRIVFSGVGKSEEEIRLALRHSIHQVNVESRDELELVSRLAVAEGVEVPTTIRVNPDVDARTHAKITTGRRENKFGIDIDLAPEAFAHAATLPGLRPVGVAVHLGSQLLDLEPYRVAYARLAELVETLRGSGLAIERLDLGGGIGIAYGDEHPPSLARYAEIVAETVGGLGCRMVVEPGRSLVGAAGMLLARTLLVKEGGSRTFLVLDAAMNDLIRPALYEAWHTILPVAEPGAEAGQHTYDVVGPICESGDTFAINRHLPPTHAGDLVVFAGAGAYGAVMASQYNSRPLVPEVLVNENRFAIVRKRPTFEEMVASEAVPDWL